METAIILASFGVIDEKIREKTTDALFNEIVKEFPQNEVVQAYTSKFIIKKLGGKFLSVEDQINKLVGKKLIIMPTHLINGEEFKKKIKIFESEEIRVINPIFAEEDEIFNYERLLKIILKKYPIVDENLILVGHGSKSEHNEFYEKFQEFVDENYKNIHVGVLEENDVPSYENVLERLKKLEKRKIFLAPLLFNGGSHVELDIKEKWRKKLENENYEVGVYVDGLGTFEEFRRIYIEKIGRILYDLPKNS